MFPLEITKHFVVAHVKILEEQGFCANSFLLSQRAEGNNSVTSDLTKLFLNHRFTNLDRGLFKDNEIDNVADPTLVKYKRKKYKENIEDKHVPDIMDLSDLENASGYFSISYSGSDTFLFA